LKIRWAWHVAHIGEIRNAYKILLGKPEGKKPLRRPRHRWEDNIKMGWRAKTGFIWLRIRTDGRIL
jgi:hypothetical protein